MATQLSLFPLENEPESQALDVHSYDYYIVAFSGGKDSVSCVLHLLELGIPKEKIELWHHEIDGREGSTLMDWQVTPHYCRAFAQAFNLPIYFSWKVGGFEREMLRDNQPTAPTRFEIPEGEIVQIGGKGPNGTRRKFPQVSADLSVRWCSAYLKVDVGAAAIRNQARFNHKRTLFITGERAEESAARAKYAIFEPDRADNRTGKKKRHVDHWRPVHDWTESQIWAIIERWQVNPHPAYKLGWGRVSCMNCIFASNNQCASSRQIDPTAYRRITHYEREFRVTIHRTKNANQRADAGTPYASMNPHDIKTALNPEYNDPIFIDNWSLPAGAFGDQSGPC